MTAPRIEDPFLAAAMEEDDPFLAAAKAGSAPAPGPRPLRDLLQPTPQPVADVTGMRAFTPDVRAREAEYAKKERREILPQIGRGLAEAGYRTAGALGALTETASDAFTGRPGQAKGILTNPIRRSRDEARDFYGEPETNVGRATNLGAQVVGDISQVGAGGRAVRAVLPWLEGGATASGTRRFLGGVAANTAGALPVTAGQAVDPETSLTTMAAELTDSPFLDRLASSTAGRFVGDLGADLALSVPFEILPSLRQGAKMRAAGVAEHAAPLVSPSITPATPAQHTELGTALEELLAAREQQAKRAVEGLPLVPSEPYVPEGTVRAPSTPRVLDGLPVVRETPEALQGLPVVDESLPFAGQGPRPYEPLFPERRVAPAPDLSGPAVSRRLPEMPETPPPVREIPAGDTPLPAPLRDLPVVRETPTPLRGLPTIDETLPAAGSGAARRYERLFPEAPKPVAAAPTAAPERSVLERARDRALPVDQLPKLADFGIDTSKLPPDLVAKLDAPDYLEARRESLNQPVTAHIQTPERQAARAKTIEDLYQKRGVADATIAPIPERPAGRKPTLHIVMGVPAAGKSSVFADPILKKNPWAWLADSDEFKKTIDEYRGGENASAVHEESDQMMLGMVDRLMAEGRDIVLPKVGKSEGSLRSLMEEFSNSGYDVQLYLNELPPEKAAQRVYDRWKKEKRFVDAAYLLGDVGDKPTQVFQRLKNHPSVQGFAHYSNDVDFGAPPIKVEEGTNPHPQAQKGGTDGRPAEARSAAGDGTPAVEGGSRRDAGPLDREVGGGPEGAAPAEAPAVDPTLGRPRLTGADGVRDTVTLPDGSKVPVTFRVVDAGDLRPSHNPLSFAENPDYPAGVQGRRYHTDRAAQENVAGGTSKLDPDRLLRDTGSASGTPIVTPDGVVVGGNQRTMMLQRASEVAPERMAEYRRLLTERAQRFGIDPATLEGMQTPVLVRELDPTGTNVTDPQSLRRFNDLTDTVSKKSRSNVDEGMARAARMRDATHALDTFAETVGPNETLRGYLDGTHGRKFIDALIADGVLTRAEAGRFFDSKGQVTGEAKDLLERTFYAAAIGNADVLERVPKSILNKLDSSLPALVRSGRDGTYALKGPLAEALDELAQVAGRKAEGSGISSLADLRAQQDMFAEAAADPRARHLADVLESSPKSEVTEAFRTYGRRVDEAMRASGANDMFGYTPPKPEELFQQVFGEGARESATSGLSGTLFANPIEPALRALTRNREISGATFAGLGALMQESDDPDIKATGRFMIGLGALHAIGLPRIARAGGKVGEGVVGALRQSTLGRKAVEFVNPEALLTPEVRSAIGDYENLVSKGKARGAEFGKAAAKLGPEGDRAVSDLIEGENWGASPEDLEATMTVAQGIADEFDALGRMKVESGILPEAAVKAHQGKYAGPRLYAEYEALDALGEKAGTGAPRKTRIGEQKKRTLGSDPESLRIRDAKGEIREASYRSARGIEKGYRDVAAAKLFQGLRSMPGVVHPDFADLLDDFLEARNMAKEARATGASAEEIKAAEDLMASTKQELDQVSSRFRTGQGDYVAMPDTPGMGVLRGMVVKKEVANSLNGLPDMRVTGPFTRFWKQKNTVWNPGTHIGNVASNVTMAHMAGLPMWEQPRRLVEAARDMGGYGKATRALAESGVLDLNVVTAGNEGAAAGRRADRKELLKLLETSRPSTVKRLQSLGLEHTTWDGLKDAFGKVQGPLARLYNNEDNVFRVAYYLQATMPKAKGGLGLSAKEAVERTRNDLINFRTRSPLIRTLRGTVAPFVLYPAKALPTFAKHVIEHPWRYLGLMAAWGLTNELSENKVGEIPAEDLPPAQRRGKTGHGLPGFTQLPFTGPRGEKAGYDVSRWTPLSALTTNAPPGASASLLSDRFPSILNPSGPVTDLASIPLNVDPYTGEKRFSPAMTGTELGSALAEAAGDQVLPPLLGFQRRRLVEDFKNKDPGAAKVDAAGLLGLRPRYVRPGEYAQRAQYDYEQAILKARQDLRRGLRRSNSAERDAELYDQFEQRTEALQEKYQTRTNP